MSESETTSIERQTSAVEIAARVRSLMKKHHAYRAECVNLCASEAVTSAMVREALACEAGRRYWSETGDYAGGKYIQEIELLATRLSCDVFSTSFANIYPVSGHVALMAAITACTSRDDLVLFVPEDGGGYTAEGFVAQAGLRQGFLPFDESTFRVPGQAAAEMIIQREPKVVVLGASICPYPFPVSEVAPACQEVGAKLIYDGAHVLGLIAGGQYQDPIAEGADVLVASTNKTFPGPARGVILTNDEHLYRKTVEILLPAPFYQSNHNVGTAFAFACALAEVAAAGSAFADQIVRNTQALSAALRERDVPLIGDQQDSSSHQVILGPNIGSSAAIELCAKLEAANICADTVVRLGTQQVTRLGMGPGEMDEIADIVAAVASAGAESSVRDSRERATALAAGFQSTHFVLSRDDVADGAAFEYFELAPQVASEGR